MKKLKKLASRIELTQGFRGGEHGKKSKGCERNEVGDSRGDEGVGYRVKHTRQRSGWLPYEITGSVDDLREEPSGIIGKIYATLQGNDRKDKKPKDLPSRVEQHKKNAKTDNPRQQKKSTKDEQSETINLEQISKNSMTDGQFTASSSVQVLRYQEAKRTLSNARDSFVTSPLHPTYLALKENQQGSSSHNNSKKKKTLCDSRGCKQAKSKVEFREAETDVTVDLQELIAKIQELKKTVEDLEAAKRNATLQKIKVPEENASSQTTGRFLTDLLGVREALGTCSSDLSKLRKFCQSRDCLKQIEERRSISCCNEKSGHLHTLIDGVKVVVKFPQEKLPERQQQPLADGGLNKIAAGSHETPDEGTFVKDVAEPDKRQVEKGPEEMSHEATHGEAKGKRDMTCAEACTIDEAIADSKIPSKLDSRKNIEGNVPSCSPSKKDLQILQKKSDSKIKDQKEVVDTKKAEMKLVNCGGPEDAQSN